MFDKLKNMFGDSVEALKDKAISVAMETVLKFLFAKYGEVLSIEVQTGKKQIDATIQLKGEEQPSIIHLQEYEILVADDDSCAIKFGAIKTNKEWFNLLAEDYLAGKPITLPKGACPYAKKLL